ncbi:CoA transferase subunit A [Pseudomonas sp. TTU2014-080ASC]|uniref:CoA transferase subunit A n=1 Tax=Pseudomonas sp. TTU2014-080ASC TaxID=1729724 RepID=UPI0007184619|nr:CoA-transferase [Pseudomonas sp. TTU2014-080ASC]KRW57453.1 CoA-transferase [Pseudomonas sp. TTU2014-080ASC]
MNKQMTTQDAVALLKDGMTVGFGGWGPRRKPMAVVREILRSDVKDLTVVGYGGPEMGMLCAAGKVRKLIFGFATMDAIPLEPWFRKCRQAGQIKELMELDEGMYQWGLRAAGMRLPFLPTRCGLATDVTRLNPEIKTITSPYEDGEVLLAMPALNLDISFLHVNEADRLGNTLITGNDAYFDHLMARASKQCVVSCERISERFELTAEQARFNLFERYLVTGVVHAPFGAHPTTCAPDYGWDLSHMKRYSESAEAENGWAAYMEEFVLCSESEYQAKNGGSDRLSTLAQPVF